MRIRSWSLFALALLAGAQLSCATVGPMPAQESMPSARAGLLPEQRIFYDALQDYGDWTLIEPFGYVFRPYVNEADWRPYEYGYWAPSDVYGWVWISAEPFGWATYHYGEWMYDRYQGWVWIPGSDWAPAWVSWEETPDYIGWAPRFPDGYGPDLAPDGGYLYVQIADLPAADVQARVRTKGQLGEGLGLPRRIENLLVRDGVRFNAGPKLDGIERRSGPLTRVKLEDLFSSGPAVTRPGAGPARQTAPAPSDPFLARKPGPRRAPAGAFGDSTTVEAMRRAAEEAARAARAVTRSGAAPPPSIGVVRRAVEREPGPAGRPGEAVPRERPRRAGHVPAAPDSTKQR